MIDMHYSVSATSMFINYKDTVKITKMKSKDTNTFSVNMHYSFFATSMFINYENSTKPAKINSEDTNTFPGFHLSPLCCNHESFSSFFM